VDQTRTLPSPEALAICCAELDVAQLHTREVWPDKTRKVSPVSVEKTRRVPSLTRQRHNAIPSLRLGLPRSANSDRTIVANEVHTLDIRLMPLDHPSQVRRYRPHCIILEQSSSHQQSSWSFSTPITYDVTFHGSFPLLLALPTCQAAACSINVSNLPSSTYGLSSPSVDQLDPKMTQQNPPRPPPALVNSLQALLKPSRPTSVPPQSFNPGASCTVPAEVK
jgi:hypothetical protein